MRKLSRGAAVGRGLTRRVVLGSVSALGVIGGMAGATVARAAPPRQGEKEEAMEPRITHLNPEGMHVNPAFSQAVVVEGAGRTIYVGGQNAVDAQGNIVGVGDLAAQTEQVFTNLETVLAAAGATLHDVVKWTVFVVQGQDLGPGFAVSQQRWGTSAPPPAISAAFVASLAHPDFLVEIEAIAVVGAS